MKKTKLIMIATFLIVFAAGIVMGRSWTAERNSHPRSRESWLAKELKLDTEQRKSIEEIWGGVMRESRKAQGERRKALTDKRDAAVLALLSEEQKVEYDRIMAEYEQARAQMTAEREAAFNEAVARTKAILTDEQREKYEQLLTRFPRGERRSSQRHPSREGPPPPPSPDERPPQSPKQP
jgi:Spy/CpxP family protein refolding chaperone